MTIRTRMTYTKPSCGCRSSEQCPDMGGELMRRSGSKVDVVRPLTIDEADIDEVGPMFKVRWRDGFEADVFEDELS